MDCPNCGQFLDSSGFSNYAKCDYCKTKIAVMTTIEHSFSITGVDSDNNSEYDDLKKLLTVASIDMNSGKYQEAYNIYNDLTKQYPTAWETYANQAICVFWMGRSDMKHMSDVKSLIAKAKNLDGDVNVLNKVAGKIAYNLALIGAKREKLGANIKWSINCFKISKDIAPDYPERDELIEEYVYGYCNETMKMLESGLARDKKNYDPPKGEIINIYTMSSLCIIKEKDIIKKILAFTKHKAEKYRNDGELVTYQKHFEKLFRESFGINNYSCIKFKLFGSPEIVSG